MDIHGTKKMLDQLQVKSANSGGAAASLFTWHANLMTLNRRKVVVLVNDSNRYCIVIYGMKKKDFESFGTIVQSAIRTHFIEKGLSEEVVDRYLEEAGDVEILKSKNRQTTSWLNKACETVSFLWEHFQNDSFINSELSSEVNNLLVGVGKGYFLPQEKMYEDLEAFIGNPIFKRRAAVLYIRLNLKNNFVWRRVVVPLDYSFYKLHQVIQKLFGWTNSHLHEFAIFQENGKGGPVVQLVQQEDVYERASGVPVKLDSKVRLSDYFPARMVYIYDFGDDWKHEIAVEEVIEDYDQPWPVCLDGAGDRPPEDVGGEGGYAFFLEVMADPDHPEHASMKEWASGDWNMRFDLKDVNRVLRGV